jgi:hypothetical protein
MILKWLINVIWLDISFHLLFYSFDLGIYFQKENKKIFHGLYIMSDLPKPYTFI